MKKKRVISVIVVLIACCVILIYFLKNLGNKINEKNMRQDTYINETQKNDEKIEENGSDSGKTDVSDKITDMQEKVILFKRNNPHNKTLIMRCKFRKIGMNNN